MAKWEKIELTSLNARQKSWLVPAKRLHQTNLVMCVKDIDEKSYESIVIGEINPRNCNQAHIICKALNEAEHVA